MDYDTRTHHSDVDTYEHLQPADLKQIAVVEASVPIVGWILLGVTVVAVGVYLGYHYATSKTGKPTRPLTPDEEAQFKQNQGKPAPQTAPAATSTPSVNPQTGAPTGHEAWIAVACCGVILAIAAAGGSWLFRHRTAA